jgi:hypothetical protein
LLGRPQPRTRVVPMTASIISPARFSFDVARSTKADGAAARDLPAAHER